MIGQGRWWSFASLILMASSLPLLAIPEIARKIVMTFQTPAPAAGEAATLSAREQEILVLLSQRKVSKEIADRLSISYHTVRVHTKHIYEKLHVRSRSEAVLKYMTDKGGSPTSAADRTR